MNGARRHPAAFFALSRREVLAQATALGMTAAAARALLGLPAPAEAQTAPKPGGTLRMEMETRPLRDPRLAEWSQVTNVTRGWLEYLVEYQNDGSFRGMLLESWQANSDATEYLLRLRPGVTWTTGEPFTADQVAANFARWCDASVPGNAMAGPTAALQEGGRLRPGAAEVLDPLRLRLRLAAPDVTLIAALADYPAGVVHPAWDGRDPAQAVGTGPYRLETNEPGTRQVLVRNPDHRWWGTAVVGGPWLDRIEYVDLGPDPSAAAEAAAAGLIDATYQTVGHFIDDLDALGWTRSDAATATTLAIRFNQGAPEFRDRRVRRALQLAVDNQVVLELGHAGRGILGENHHVCPIQPDYAALPPPRPDPAQAVALLAEAGMAGHEFDLVSLDDAWQSVSCDAVAAQLRDAGIGIRRTVLPGADYWDRWKEFPFSATEWNMRPLGVQVLALAYRSGAPWNETGFANAAFDADLARAMAEVSPTRRRRIMARLQRILQEEGVLIQPYWRTIFRHAAPQVRGIEAHPTFEHHHYRWWIDA